MSVPRILIAGIGNVFFGDDGFGVEVARRLAERSMPDGVRVVDFGIRGIDLTYALLDDYDLVILVDAVPRGGAPGTLYLIEPDFGSADADISALDSHSLDPQCVLGLARSLGGKVERVLLVGCEPAAGDVDEERMELSVPVRAAIAEAIRMIDALVAEMHTTGLRAM